MPLFMFQLANGCMGCKLKTKRNKQSIFPSHDILQSADELARNKAISKLCLIG